MRYLCMQLFTLVSRSFAVSTILLVRLTITARCGRFMLFRCCLWSLPQCCCKQVPLLVLVDCVRCLCLTSLCVQVTILRCTRRAPICQSHCSCSMGHIAVHCCACASGCTEQSARNQWKSYWTSGDSMEHILLVQHCWGACVACFDIICQLNVCHVCLLTVVVICRTTQALCWALVPLTMGFVDAGEFSFIGRYVTSTLPSNSSSFAVKSMFLAFAASGRASRTMLRHTA